MKTGFLKLFAGSFLLVLLACNNEKKKEEKTTIKEEQPGKTNTPAEPKKTEISLGPDGAEVKTKSGTEVKVGDTGVTVGSKDIKIDIKKKDDN